MKIFWYDSSCSTFRLQKYILRILMKYTKPLSHYRTNDCFFFSNVIFSSDFADAILFTVNGFFLSLVVFGVSKKWKKKLIRARQTILVHILCRKPTTIFYFSLYAQTRCILDTTTRVKYSKNLFNSSCHCIFVHLLCIRVRARVFDV